MTIHHLQQQDFTMIAHTIFIPEKFGTHTDENKFKWTLGANKGKANKSLLYQTEWFGFEYWEILAGSGSMETEDYCTFSMGLPYLGDKALEGIYTLLDGLTFHHGHWAESALPGGVYKSVGADSAILNITNYDLVTDVVEGTFEALFKSSGYRLFPKGSFRLKRVYPTANNPGKKTE
jgi:hypothetical protein